MTNAVQPRVSSSTPFFKSKSSTIAPILPNRHKNTVTLNGKQRKRSLTTNEISPNTARKADIPEPLHNKNVVTSLSLKASKKNSKLLKEPRTLPKKKSNIKLPSKESLPRKPSSGSLTSSETRESSSSYYTAEINCDTSNQVSDTFADSLSILSIPEDQPESVHCDRPIHNKKERVNDSKIGLQEPIQLTPSISSQIISSSKSLLKKSMNTSKEEAKKRSVSLLQRTRSRKWSNPSSDPRPLRSSWKSNPTAFMASPAASSCIDRNQKFSLMHRLLTSMTLGGYITDGLHIPMDVWYQQNVRLHYVEAKTAASELVIAVLEKMDARNSIDLHLSAARSELKVLKQTLNQINETLRKLGCPVPEVLINEKRNTNRHSTNRTSQTIVIWSTKFTKSVEKMRHEAMRNNTPSDEQNRLYIMTLIRLFTKAKILGNKNFL
ncbi:unnamed protein product [Rhizopus stolonifer]